MSDRTKRAREILKELAGTFISQESNRMSLITVTDVQTSPDGKRAKIFFTVYPEDKEHAAHEFLMCARSDFRKFIKNESRLAIIPHIDFVIDAGEKNRQRIDEISRDT